MGHLGLSHANTLWIVIFIDVQSNVCHVNLQQWMSWVIWVPKKSPLALQQFPSNDAQQPVMSIAGSLRGLLPKDFVNKWGLKDLEKKQRENIKVWQKDWVVMKKLKKLNSYNSRSKHAGTAEFVLKTPSRTFRIRRRNGSWETCVYIHIYSSIHMLSSLCGGVTKNKVITNPPLDPLVGKDAWAPTEIEFI